MTTNLKLYVIVLTALAALFPPSSVLAEDYSYDAIANRYSDTELDSQSVREAEMHGECLVGLKELNFQKRDDFDPVAEWTNYRAISLLEQFPPCTVLIMIEVARDRLIQQEALKNVPSQ
jgi:hypothetical protein